MPSADELRLGGTASATASSGSISIITTSTMRKLKCASIAARCCGGRRAAAIAEPPQLVEVQLLGLAAAAAAELVDRRQADRQIVAVEGQHARRRELRANPGPAGPWSGGTGSCRDRRSARKRPCSAVAATVMPLRVLASATKMPWSWVPLFSLRSIRSVRCLPSWLNSPTLIAAPSAPDFRSKRSPS